MEVPIFPSHVCPPLFWCSLFSGNIQ
jgi:hypothetical protein